MLDRDGGTTFTEITGGPCVPTQITGGGGSAIDAFMGGGGGIVLAADFDRMVDGEFWFKTEE